MSISFLEFPPFKKVVAGNKFREHSLTVYLGPAVTPAQSLRYGINSCQLLDQVGGLIRLWFELVKVEEADAPDEPNIWIKIATTRCCFQRSLSEHISLYGKTHADH